MTNIVEWLKTNLFTANRIVALVTFLASLAAFIVGIVGVLPGAWQNTALAIVGVLGKVIVGFKFLEGSQRWDHLMVQQSIAMQDVPLPTRDEEESDTPAKLDAPPKDGIHTPNQEAAKNLPDKAS